jgi:hypothetical protein
MNGGLRLPCSAECSDCWRGTAVMCWHPSAETLGPKG